MKRTISILLVNLISFTAFAQWNYDNQSRIFSNSNTVSIGSAPTGNYGVLSNSLEINSSESTYFSLKSGGNDFWLVNHPIYGNYIKAPVNKAFNFFINNFSIPSIQLQTNGNVSIGRSGGPMNYKLAVGGKIIAEELKVQLQAQWPDYVFKKDYQLPKLAEVEKQIKEKGHLANLPSASEVKEHGFEVGEMNRLLLEKVEELTLYTIDQQKQLDQQNKEIEELKIALKTLLNKKQ